MQPIKGWDNIQVNRGSSQIPKGGYVCKIMGAKTEANRNGRQMLVVIFDVCQGEQSGFFQNKYQAGGSKKWANQATLRFNLPDESDSPDDYQRKAQRIKRFISDVEQSNDPYIFKWDEKTLRGKFVGGLFGREQFKAQDGTLAWSTKIRFTTSVEAIQTGNFRIPDDSPYKEYDNGYSYQQPQQDMGTDDFTEIDSIEADDDLPF